MALREELERSGNWLFRWRSYFPFLFLPMLLLALRESEYLDRVFGSGAQTVWEVFCISLSFLGLLLRCLTIGWVPEGTSGRNTKAQLAEVLNLKGAYSIVRHPLYFANFLITMGMILFVQVWWFTVISVLLFWIYYERIMFAEEEFLREKFGDRYLQWAKRTPVFFPNPSKWIRPDSRFSMKMVLKREYSGFFGIIVMFVLLKFFANLLGEGQFRIRVTWVVFLLLGFAIYMVVHLLRKKTKFLHIHRKQ